MNPAPVRLSPAYPPSASWVYTDAGHLYPAGKERKGEAVVLWCKAGDAAWTRAVQQQTVSEAA